MSQPLLIALFLVVCFAASFTQTVGGFGSGIIMISILPFFMPTASVVAICALSSLIGNLCIMISLRKHVSFKLIWIPTLAYFLISTPMIFLAAAQPDGLLKKLLAAVLIILSVYFIFFSQKIRIKANALNGAATGVISGVMGGFFGLNGPPMVLYMLGTGCSNEVYVSTIQFFFIISCITGSIARALSGTLDLFVLKYWAIGVPAILLGFFLGRRVFYRMSGKVLKWVVYTLMAASGVTMLLF